MKELLTMILQVGEGGVGMAEEKEIKLVLQEVSKLTFPLFFPRIF